MRLLHAYVENAIESEVLSEWGEVTAVGHEYGSGRNVDTFIEADIRDMPFDLPLDNRYFFGLFHPPCGRFSRATPNRSKDKFPDLIEWTRFVAENTCKYWVIENVPRAPLKNATYLEGSIFDLDIRYKRGFETNYHLEQPDIPYTTGYSYNIQSISKERARVLKGYEGDYPVHAITRNCIPSQYVKYLVECLPPA